MASGAPMWSSTTGVSENLPARFVGTTAVPEVMVRIDDWKVPLEDLFAMARKPPLVHAKKRLVPLECRIRINQGSNSHREVA